MGERLSQLIEGIIGQVSIDVAGVVVVLDIVSIDVWLKPQIVVETYLWFMLQARSYEYPELA